MECRLDQNNNVKRRLMRRSGSYFSHNFIVGFVSVICCLLFNSALAQDACDNTYTLVALSDTFNFANDIVVRADIPENQTKIIGCINVAQSGFYRINSMVSYSDAQHNESFFFQVCDTQTLNCQNACNPNLGPYNIVVDETEVADTTVRDGGTFYLTQGDNILTVTHYAKIAYDYPRYINGPDSIDGAQSIHMKGFVVDFVDHAFDVKVEESPNITAVNPGDIYQYRYAVKNVEKSTVYFVNLKNALPPYVTPVSYSEPPGSFDSDTLFWTFDSLTTGDSIIVNVDVRVDDSPPIRPFNLVNKAWVTGSCDFNSVNGLDSSVVVILPPVFYDLEVKKTTITDSLFRGQNLSFQIKLKNSGPDTAANITLVDIMPPNLSFLNTDFDPQKITLDSIYWQIDTLAVGDSIFFNLSTKVDAEGFQVPSQISNKAIVISENDISPANNEAISSVNVVPRRADLSVLKTVDQDSIFKEKSFSYSIKLQNLGPDTATNVELRDFMPANMIVRSFEPAPFSVSGDTVIWRIDTLTVNATREISIAAKADTSKIEVPLRLTNRVDVKAEADPDTSNNTATAILDIVPRRYDLSVIKSADRDSIFKEQSYSYQITVENAGPDTASHILVKDVKSDNIIASSYNPQPVRVTEDSIFWRIDTLAIGERRVFSIGARPDTSKISLPDELVNMVFVESENEVAPINNQDTSIVRVVPRRYDLSVTKTTDRDSIFREHSYSYRITVENAGPDMAKEILLQDIKSDNIIALSYEPDPVSVAGDSIFWRMDSLAVGERRVFTINAKPDTSKISIPAELTNIARIESENEINPINNEDTAIVRVVPRRYDLSIEKTASQDSIFKDQSYSYQIIVENAGPDTASNILVKDVMSDNIIGFSYNPEPVRIVGDSVFWRIDTLKIGERRVFSVGARPDIQKISIPDQLTNVARIESENDVTPTNNEDSAVVRVVPRRYDLSVTKTASRDSIFKEHSYSYRIDVENAGPDMAKEIFLKDVKSDNIIALSYDPEPGRLAGDSLFWRIDSLAVGERRVFTIHAKPDTNKIGVPTELTNVAFIESENEIEPTNNQGTAIVRVVPRRYDLSVEKTVSRDSIFKEHSYSYQIIVENAGPDTASHTLVKDVKSENIIALSYDPEPVRIAGDSIFWRIDTLTIGEQCIFTVGAKPDTNKISIPDELTNIAVIESENDVTPSNNEDTAIVRVVPRRFDLSVTKTTDRDSIFKEHSYNYRIIVENAGPDMAKNIVLKDVKSDNIIAISYEPEPDRIVGDSLFWRLDSLAVGGRSIFTIHAKPDTSKISIPAELVNMARIESDNDTSPANNEDTAIVKVVPRRYDLQMTKTASADSVFPAQGFRYTLSILNAGPDTAYSIKVKDAVPELASLLGFEPQPQNITADSIFWHLDLLPPDETTELTIRARADTNKVTTPRPITNTGLVLSERDINSANNLSSVTNYIVRKRSDLQLIKSTSVDSVDEGGTFSYLLSIENIGRDVAETILLWDLPSPLTAISDYSLPPDYSQQDTLFWLFDSLSAGDFFEIEYTAQAPDSVPTTPFEIPSFARIFAENDVNPQNDFSESIIIIRPQDDCIVFDRNVLIPQRGEELEIEFELSTGRNVTIDIYDVSGYRVNRYL